MYQIMKNIIMNGGYVLEDMLRKIDTAWVSSKLTEAQRSELLSLARAKADPAQSYAPLQEQIRVLAQSVASLSARVSALGGAFPEPEEWPEYVQPSGAFDAYYAKDKITYQHRRYVCAAPEGTACVWPPDVYPEHWKEAAEEALDQTPEEGNGRDL